MKILVGVDATPSCQGVVQAAAARPWPAGSSFLLATAIDSFFFARAPALLAEAKKCAQQHLEHTAECLQNAGWNVTSEVILGKPRRAISPIRSRLGRGPGHGRLARPERYPPSIPR
jgi:hypothetical protein